MKKQLWNQLKISDLWIVEYYKMITLSVAATRNLRFPSTDLSNVIEFYNLLPLKPLDCFYFQNKAGM